MVAVNVTASPVLNIYYGLKHLCLQKEPRFGLTVRVLEADPVPQEPPLVVRVKVAVPLNVEGGVYVAFKVVAFGVNVPPYIRRPGCACCTASYRTT
jgi:hypothetical protein